MPPCLAAWSICPLIRQAQAQKIHAVGVGIRWFFGVLKHRASILLPDSAIRQAGGCRLACAYLSVVGVFG